MKTLILGLGKPILCDDGIGHYVAQKLEVMIDRQNVQVKQASISGFYFLELLKGYDRAIIIDAIKTHNGKVGDIYRLEPAAFDKTKHETSAHHVNFATVLEFGKRLGIPLPREIVVYAIEVDDVNSFRESCTPTVAGTIPKAVNMIMEDLAKAD